MDIARSLATADSAYMVSGPGWEVGSTGLGYRGENRSVGERSGEDVGYKLYKLRSNIASRG